MRKFRIKHLHLLPVIILSFLIFKLITEANISFKALFSFLYSCSAYLIWGAVIAYLFNPIMVFFDKLIASKKDNEKAKKIKRIGVIAFIYTTFLGLITLFVVAVIPTVMEGIEEVLNKIPEYISSVRDWSLRSFGWVNNTLEGLVGDYLERVFELLYNILSGINLNDIGGRITSALTGSMTAIIRIFFGFGISVYFLYSKESLLLEIKKLIYAVFSTEKAKKIIKISASVNDIFTSFVGSKIIESAIMFVIGIIVLYFLNIPLAAFISFLIAITNIIPYFGPYIGGIPSVLITLMFDPIKALWVIIYAIGIQLLDNFIIGPKVMSDQVGISPLLVIAGVTVGGAFGGIFGMFIGVPIIAAIKLVFYDSFIERRLAGKNVDKL